MLAADDEVISNIHSVNIFFYFRRFLKKLWILWELVLLGEPLLLIAPSPVVASECVLALVSIICPVSRRRCNTSFIDHEKLLYGGDFRPFFTIHDGDFGRFSDHMVNVGEAKKGPTMPSVILGATNPFFLKAFDHWPHLLTIGFGNGDKKEKKKGPGINDMKDSLKTSYKSSSKVDDTLLKSLKLVTDPSAVNQVIRANNEILRRYFLQQTDEFLSPLESYFNLHLMPRNKWVSLSLSAVH